MPTWTSEQFRDYQHRRRLQSAKPEQIVQHEPLAETPREKEGAQRFVVRILSFRTRLLDPDNLVGGVKFLVDGLRYSHIIPGDSPDHIELSVLQEKVATRNKEKTVIQIREINK